MKRFYADVTIEPAAGGRTIALDGRPVKTPAKHALLLPTAALAEAVAGEWRAQGDKVDPRSMPMTGLANAAIDRIASDPAHYAASLAIYGETDLTCYRAEAPRPLVERQAEAWDPVIAWARRRYDVDFAIVEGVMHEDQPAETVTRLGQAIAARGAFELAAMTQLVTLSGSLLIALMLAERALDPDAAWAAAQADEIWQEQQWGEDADATQVRDKRRRDFDAAYRFLELLDHPQPRSS